MPPLVIIFLPGKFFARFGTHKCLPERLGSEPTTW